MPCVVCACVQPPPSTCEASTLSIIPAGREGVDFGQLNALILNCKDYWKKCDLEISIHELDNSSEIDACDVKMIEHMS